MESFLDRGIKEVIDGHPDVAGILDDYKIGCAPCNVGTCRLKDIVEIHGLSPEVEAELLTVCHYLQTGARELGFDARALPDLREFTTEGDHVYRLDPDQPGLISHIPRGRGPEVVYPDVAVGRQIVTSHAPLALIGGDGALVEVTEPVTRLRLK